MYFSQAKLSGSKSDSIIITVSDGILASCSFESSIKFWDFQNNENYVLSVQDHSTVTCINYCTSKSEFHTMYIY